MSGVKVRTVTVQQNRLRELERQARLVRDAQAASQAADRARTAEARRRQKLQATLDHERGRQERLERTLDGLSGRVLTLDRATNQRFADQRAELLAGLGRLEAGTEDLRDELDRSLTKVHRALEQQERELGGRIDTITTRLDDREGLEEAAAQEWAAAVTARLRFIHEEFRHAQFAPGELATLQEGLRLAEDSLGRGLHQAAVGALQGLWADARRLQGGLELAEAEWDRLHALAAEAVDRLLAEAEARKSVSLELDGQPAFDLAIDHWTLGGLSDLETAGRALRKSLDRTDDPPDADALREAIEAAGGSQAKLEELESRARSAVLASVERADVQSALLARLGQLGYRLRWSRWAEDDFRGANHMALASPSDEEMVIVVSPTEEADGVGARVEVNFRDRSPNETVRRMRLKAVEDVLSERLGASPGGFAAERGFEVGNAPDERFDQRRLAPESAPENGSSDS